MTNDPKQKIAELTQEIMTKQHELNELMRTSLSESVDDYRLKNTAGELRLSQLFGDRRDLVLIHNMGKRCPYCTLWADGLNGVFDHFENRAAFVVVSPDSPEVQREFAQSRNWTMPMVSSEGSSFSKDLGFEGAQGVMPGFSTFHLEDDGTIERVAWAFFGPGDSYSAIWHMIGVLRDGAGDWQPRVSYP